MSIESGGDSPIEKLEPRDEKRIEQFKVHDRPGRKLYRDCVNIFGHLVSITERSFPIKPLETYEARYRSQERETVVDYIMNHSEPGTVAALDSLITEFNANLDRINREKDFGVVKNFFDKALKLVEESQ